MSKKTVRPGVHEKIYIARLKASEISPVSIYGEV